MHVASEKIFCFGRFILDPRRGCLRAGDQEIKLRPKSFDVLRYLVENAGRLVPKDEIIKAIWPDVTVTDESLMRCISDVRLALEDTDQNIVKTMPRRGYIFAAAVSSADTSESIRAAPPSASTLPPPFSLVVLPFTSFGGDPEKDYLADAITDGLINYLSRMRGAHVIPRSTALSYKGKAVDARHVGHELGVRYVLEGSEQHDDTRIRVTVQLIDVDAGTPRWADRFDVNQSHLLQVQDTITTRIARAIQIELSSIEAARLSKPQSDDVVGEAEHLALRAEALFLRYGPSRRQTEMAFELSERALNTDPNNIRALSILAEKYATRITGMQSTDRDLDIKLAEEFALRALATDANSYHARHAHARALIAQRRAEEAIVEAEHSLRLNPGYLPAYLDLCQANLMLGKADAAIESAENAMRLSPPDPYLYVFFAQKGLGHIMLGQDEDAVACLRQAVANNPDFPTPLAYLAAMLALTGKDHEAREALGRYLAIPYARTRTIAAWKEMGISDHPAYLVLRGRINEGLSKAGMSDG